jgi:copper resistance protein B
MKSLIIILAVGVSAPAMAQHQGHDMSMPGMKMPAPKAKTAVKSEPKPTLKRKPAPVAPKPAPAKPQAKVAPKAKPAKIQPGPSNAVPTEAPMEMDHGSMDHSQMDEQPAMTDMDHSAMDHGQMDHEAMDMSGNAMADMTAPMADETPPPEAGSGPARAADAIWGADAMRGSRKQLAAENGGMKTLWVMADRAEYRVRDGKNGYLWDGQGYYGGDIDKFWFKSEGEGNFGEKIESAEVQALWSHAIAPFFDLQAGVRQDFGPSDRTYAVIGIQGLAPYLFEIDGAAFLSDRGDLTARFEAEYDQRITQRLILQPRAELNLAAQDVPELGIGAGIDAAELGIRLRYEFAREFAPYIGIEQEWKVGQSAKYARAAGEDPSVTNYVIGIRFWF